MSDGTELARSGMVSQLQSVMKLLSLSVFLAVISCSSGLGPVVPKTRTQRKMISLLEKFDRWDLNGDGYLSAGELKAPMENAGYSVQEIIDFYDTNKDGKISLSEAQAGYARSADADQILKSNH
jgi:Ca2+-binding EF-hand superfamily protein